MSTAISGSGGVLITGGGAVKLTGASNCTGDVTIGAGTLNVGGVKNVLNPTTSPLGNPQQPHTVYVAPGATLQFSNDGNTLGDYQSNAPQVTLSVSGAVSSVNWTALGPVVLSGGTLTGTNGGSTWGVFQFDGQVTAAGSAASLITGSGASPFCNLALGGTTNFRSTPVQR